VDTVGDKHATNNGLMWTGIIIVLFILVVGLILHGGNVDTNGKINTLQKTTERIDHAVSVNKTIEIDRRSKQITLLNDGNYVASCPLGKTNYERASALFATGEPDITKVPNGTWGVEDPELVFGTEDTYIAQVDRTFLAKIKNWAQGLKVTIIFN